MCCSTTGTRLARQNRSRWCAPKRVPSPGFAAGCACSRPSLNLDINAGNIPDKHVAEVKGYSLVGADPPCTLVSVRMESEGLAMTRRRLLVFGMILLLYVL